jgi:23S rRNA pseudouridine1911/1915/1917 synthase
VADFEAHPEEFEDLAETPSGSGAPAVEPAVTLTLEVDSASHGQRLDK